MAGWRSFQPVKEEGKKELLCPTCGLRKLLCEKPQCPMRLHAESMGLTKELDRTSFFGGTPPAIFVGSYGYPRVLAGPLVPAVSDLTPSELDSPEAWVQKSVNEVLRYRLVLVRGKSLAHVNAARQSSKIADLLREIAMSSKSIDTEMTLKKKPSLRILFSARDAPAGPSGLLEKAVLAQNPSVPRAVENTVGDRDLRASHAVWRLFDSGVSHTHIIRLLSAGLLGTKLQRRLVPTEWSITATDDILGRLLHYKVKQYPQISEHLLFGHQALGNNVQILLMPTSWMYEAMECWLSGQNQTPETDYELYHGRKTYPTSILGAYHAVRLPILEYLARQNRQAGAIAFLEVSSEWIPLGVWRFREIARIALGKPYARTNSLEEALAVLSSRLRLPIHKWLQASRLIKYARSQMSLEKFLARG